MAALSKEDLAVIIGDDFAGSSGGLAEKFIKRIEPKPPSALTQTGAYLSMAIAVISVIGAAILSLQMADKSTVLPIAGFSAVACGWVLWSCMKVLQGYNTGGNRINSVLAMITNSLIGSILVLFADFGQPLQGMILSGFAAANLIAIFVWFWETTDCID